MNQCELYVFKNDKLIGAQDVSRWTIGEVESTMQALRQIDRTGVVSDKGRSVCATCQADMGECEIPAGKLSHGYCVPCYKDMCEQIDRLR